LNYVLARTVLACLLLEAQSDAAALDPEILNELKEKIQALDAKDKLKKNLLKKVEKLEKKIEKDKLKNTKILERMKKKITKKEMKGKIEGAQAQELLDLLNQVESVI